MLTKDKGEGSEQSYTQVKFLYTTELKQVLIQVDCYIRQLNEIDKLLDTKY